MVQPVNVDIGEELAGQVADGKAPATLPRREQAVARIVQIDRS